MPSPLRFYLDEHVSPAVAEGLRWRGRDALTTAEAARLTAPDLEQLAFAAAEGRVLVTSDEDFLRLHSAGQEHAGIVYYRQPMAIGALIRGLERVCELVSTEEMRNQVRFLS